MDNYGAIAEKITGDKLLENGSQKIHVKAWSRIKSIFARKKDYPVSIFFILGTEFCERFSHCGLRAILVMYLRKWLLFDGDTATSIYHAFMCLSFLSPLPGAIIADSYLGKYKTIIFMSILYAVGNLVMTLTSFPPPEWMGPFAGLILIGIATGGIKTCTMAFGGDQFNRGQEKETETFFAVFYFTVNLGSILSTLVTPVLRADVNCYENSCYPLAFGVPTLLMIVAIVLFICGSDMYEKHPPCGNLLGKVFRCTWYAIKHKITSKADPAGKKEHWLDYSNDKFEPEFVDDVKALWNLLFLCIPFPLFFALYEQQGSRWILQAERLDGDLVLNPLLLFLLLPVFQKVIYPIINKCGIPNRPLQRMCAGMVFAILAFTLAGFIQIKLDNEMEKPLASSESGLTLVNTLPCSVRMNSTAFPHYLSNQSSTYVKHSKGNFTVVLHYQCLSVKQLTTHTELLGGVPYRIFVTSKNNRLQLIKDVDNRNKPKKGGAVLSIFLAASPNVAAMKLQIPGSNCSNEEGITVNVTAQLASEFQSIDPNSYSVCVKDGQSNWTSINVTFHLGIGEAKTVVLVQEEAKWSSFDVLSVSKNTLSMLVLIPQYIIITIAEILFSVTGLSFGYSQAPQSMKSIVQALFLVTVSMGNVIVIIVAGIKAIPSQTFEFFLFTALMGIDTAVFIILAIFYKSNNISSAQYSDYDDTAGLTDNIPVKESKLYDYWNQYQNEETSEVELEN